MPEPVISVIMPAYNAGVFISNSIKSVKEQTYTSWELLIVNDGSTDNTKEIVEQFCKEDIRIKYYYQANGKQGKARNLALAHASGDYIAFLDADDIWVPKKLEIQLQELKVTNADLVFADAYLFEENISNKTGFVNTGKGIFKGEEGLKNFLDTNKILLSSVVAKTSIIVKSNGFTEKPSIQNAEDYYLWLQLLINGEVLYGSEKFLVYYQIHAFSASFRDRLSIQKTLEVLQELKKKNKRFKKLLTNYHKAWFMRFHYSTHDWNRKKYKALIKKNCSYIYSSAFNFFFQAVYFFFGLNTTRIVINKFINNYKPENNNV